MKLNFFPSGGCTEAAHTKTQTSKRTGD